MDGLTVRLDKVTGPTAAVKVTVAVLLLPPSVKGKLRLFGVALAEETGMPDREGLVR